MTEALILFIFLILSGFFSGAETALTSLSHARADALLMEGRPGAVALSHLKHNTTRMLVIILIGNNLVNIGASALATVLATEQFGDIGPGIAVGLLTIIILIFGEVTPKSWAARHAETASLFSAPFIYYIGKLLFPAVWALEHVPEWLNSHTSGMRTPSVTESEVMSLLRHGTEEGTIESGEKEMIERVFAFNDLRARDVMTPRSRIYALDESELIEQVLPDILAHSLSRIPLYRDNPDNITGILHLRDILQAVVDKHQNAPLASIAQEISFAPQNQPIDELFADLKHTNRHLTLVVNEHGMLQGVVTIEDLLEELVGEIYDETDRPDRLLQELAPNKVVANGRLEMRVIGERFNLDPLPGKPTDTVSLWILNHAARIPSPGEQFNIDGLHIEINDATDRVILKVSIELPEPNALLEPDLEEPVENT